MGSRLLAVFRILIYVSWTFLLIPVQAIGLRLHRPYARRLPYFYHRSCCWIFGFRLVQLGAISEQRPTLFVSNHTSYLDITMLSALIPGVSFISKAEVRDWPFFGRLARLQETVFIERRTSRTSHHRDAIHERLKTGDRLVLFPEGTSNDGNRVLPFKSALLSVAEKKIDDQPLVVQPVSIAYTHLNGVPMGRLYRPFYAWYGDMELAPHFLEMAGLGKVTIVVTFHPPVTVEAHGSRKELAEACGQIVARGVAAAITGQLPPATAGTPAQTTLAPARP
ncbi:MAG: 1-acyl-sn-glycerol-3-phosphate acyltransferase [Alphaproteobacteria bacterium]|nr:1-acyl-sn-glycerol-3-phosphate acyltransferase [Alphaproteobacteria bacterium]